MGLQVEKEEGERMGSIDWKFIIGDIVVPIAIFAAGFVCGETVEKRKAKAKVKGNGNTVIQNSDIHR